MQEYRSTRDNYYTHAFQDIMDSLGYILVSEEFYDNSRRSIRTFDGMSINNDHPNFEDYKATGTYDHGVICATFKYKPISGSGQPINVAIRRA